MPFLRRSQAGSIVQIGTITAVENHYYPGGGLSYGPMKAALINFISQLAKELGPDGISANAVSPGPIYLDGGSWDRIRQKKPDYYEANKARHPSGRFGRAALQRQLHGPRRPRAAGPGAPPCGRIGFARAGVTADPRHQ